MHVVRVLLPPPEVNDPTLHVEHEPDFAALYSVSAPQFVHTLEPVNEYLPAAQSVQTDAPDSEYLPGTQLMHVDTLVAPMLLLYRPAEQSSQTVAAAIVLYRPVTQSRHVDSKEAPSVLLYLPGWHS